MVCTYNISRIVYVRYCGPCLVMVILSGHSIFMWYICQYSSGLLCWHFRQYQVHVDGLMLNSSISSVKALEILQSCTKQSMYEYPGSSAITLGNMSTSDKPQRSTSAMHYMMYVLYNYTFGLHHNGVFIIVFGYGNPLHITGLCEGNSPISREFPLIRTNNAGLWWAFFTGGQQTVAMPVI